MLKLTGIEKTYKVSSGDVWALKGLNIEFRKNEFVSILGPSGCGKTTLLNIIGGLDKYSKGDLSINGTSTKRFLSRDWDAYRSHSIGFVFQSYNLIPHQSVLGNVELSLTISGIDKNERTRRAKEALDKVGLEGMYYKKPNQLSGGQCQRVAIARALVNEPDILLADEPTGALDSETSTQIMALIKEIAKERLVIMVTHNSELADEYSTRIVRLKDGLIVSDTNPYTSETVAPQKTDNLKKPKMSFFTAFRLSLQNLFTKRARTLLTAFAGAIGIIGVSAVLSVSYGVQTYVNDMQEDMLSGNPVTISESTIDLMALMGDTGRVEQYNIMKSAGFVNVHSMIAQLMERSKTVENILVSNKIDDNLIKYINNIPTEYNTMVSYDYGINVKNNIYTNFKTKKSDAGVETSLTTIQDVYTAILNKTEYAKYSSQISSVVTPFMQVPDNEEYILGQYTKLSGEFAKEKNEIMVVVNKDRQLSDLLLAQLGYYSQEEFINIINKNNGSPYKEELVKERFSYEEILGKSFTWYDNDQVFNKETSPLADILPFTYEPYSDSFTNGLELRVVGILEPNEGLNYGCLSSGFYFTEALTKYVLEQNKDTEVVEYLLDQEDSDYFISGNVDYGVPMDIGIKYEFNYMYEDVDYIGSAFVGTVSEMSMFSGLFGGSDQPELYILTLRELGGVNLPSNISLYSKTFDEKNLMLLYLDQWNEDGDIEIDGVVISSDDREEIKYQDALSIILLMINTFISLITTALIAFTSLSLVVSCVMISIITYVSVVERVKEIGVIRSLGGRKKDVSYLFNAETVIIGLISGLFGVGVTYIISFIINLIVKTTAGINRIAILPLSYATIMVAISVFLNYISGFFPARIAANKDPVVALRTE